MDGDEKIYCLLCYNPVIKNVPEEIDLLKELYKLLNCPGMLSLQMNEGIRNSEFCGPCSRALIDSMNIFEQIKKLTKSLEELREQMKMCIIAAYQDDTNLKEGQTNEIRPRCLVRKTLALHLLGSGEGKEVGHDSEEDPEVKIENPEDEIDSYEGSNFSDESDEDGTEESENYDCLDKQQQPLKATLDLCEGNEFIDQSEQRDLVEGHKSLDELQLPVRTVSNNDLSQSVVGKDPLEVNPTVEVKLRLPNIQVPVYRTRPIGHTNNPDPVPPNTAAPLRLIPRPRRKPPVKFVVYSITTPTGVSILTNNSNPVKLQGQLQNGNFAASSDRNVRQEGAEALENPGGKSDGRSRHVCSICGKSGMAIGQLNQHVKDIHLEKSFECEVCKKRFTSMRYLKKHKKSHDKSRSRPCICEVCGKGFLTAKQLVGHGIVHMDKSQRLPANKFPCDKCEKVFERQSHLSDHTLRRHQRKIEHYCEICGKGFCKLQYVRAHIAQVHAERTLECDLCHKLFKTPNVLRKHVKHVHESDQHPRFPCYKCDKTFSTNSGRQDHINLTHEKIFQHFCSLCGKGFLRPYAMNLHVSEVHSGKTVECNICKKSFKSEYQMNNHRKKVHEKLRPFICEVCGKGFFQNSLLKYHLATHRDKKSLA